MKHNDLRTALIAAMLLASPLAGAESKYPAADFEPGVVYKDEKLIEQHSQASKAAAEPTAKAEEKAAPPATAAKEQSADFSAPEIMSGSESSEGAGTSAAAKDSPVGNLPIALVVLAIGGFAFWSSKKGAPKPSAAPASAPATVAVVGETSVDRYIKKLPDVAAAPETGVARYVRGLAAVAPAAPAETSVAKYLKNLPQQESSGAETGVAKYLKNVK